MSTIGKLLGAGETFEDAKARWDRELQERLAKDDADLAAFVRSRAARKAGKHSPRVTKVELWAWEALDVYRLGWSVAEIATRMHRQEAEVHDGILAALRARLEPLDGAPS